MPTKLIQLEDGVIVEVDAPGDMNEQIAFGAPTRIASDLKKVEKIIRSATNPIAAAAKALSKELYVEKVEIEFGLSFEVEGNIYITKAKTGANLNVKFITKPS